MIRAAVLAVLLVPAAVIGLDTPLVMADSHMPEDAFVTTWRVTNNDKIIKIPVGGQMGNYTVDWGDGTDSTTHVSDATHTYSTAGDYTVSISGDFKKIFLNGVQSSSVSEVKNAKQLRSIEQWGDMEWSSMTSAFRGASKMTYNATDTPDLSNVKSMEYMFHAARAFNGNLSSWNVSQVTNMGFMYQNARAFNGDISSWNVSKVTNMQAMFASADAFNQPLNRWDVSQVTNMDGMFNDASSFNGDISIWNVSAVTDMNSMFNGASSFNGDISIWNVSAVTDMSSMFDGASSFNGDISRWNVSAVTDMSSMFNGASSSSSSFNGDISIWNVSAVTDMSSMFDGASSFNGDISRWNVSAVTDMNNMFNGVSSFNQTLNDWDVLKVTDMSYMFSGAEVFNQPLNDWDVSKVNNTYGMFEFASSFNGNISSWNVSAVTNMNSMFSDASSFNQTLNDWDVLKVTDMSYMFLGAAAFNQPLNGWDVSKVTNMNSMFEYASSFNQPLNDWDVSKVTDMYYMFSSAAAFNQPLNNWNVSKVTDMDNMFSSAAAFNQPLNNWNVSAVTSMRSMFSGASSFEQNLGKWYVVPADTVYNTSDEMSLVITTIAAQNSVLDGHSHYYGIGTGGNSTLFNMTDSNLVFNATPSAGIYMVNVTAPEGDFGTNNHHVFDITVTGEDHHPPDVTADGSADVYEGSVGRLTGTASDLDTGDILTYHWTHNGAESLGITIANNTALSTTFNVTGSVEFNTQVTFTLTVNGGTSLPVAKTVVVNIQDSSGAFIATWETGTSHATVAFYVNGTDHIIDWGDGSERAVGTGWVSHLYVEAGQYRVIVDGSVDRLYHSFGDGTPEMLRYVDQWGDTEWSSMRDMFHGALNMEYRATDTPDLSRVTNMESMFSGATLFNGNISSWNVSSVTNMSSMFYYASDFKGDISSWNVSSVTSMSNMFFGAFDFNRSLNNWNVSSVLSMSGMFAQATSFDQSLNSWDVSGATSMSSMFYYASYFKGDISSWDVSAVTDMSSMFDGASYFNGDISSWDVSAVTDMNDMFSGASYFNGDISSWNVSAVMLEMDGLYGMDGMFDDATLFEQNLGNWYVVPDSVLIAWTDVPGVVGTISAQNTHLDGHSPEYNIVPGGDHTRFAINGNQLNMTSVGTKSDYTVNVTASKGTVFEDGNNWRILDVTVTGQEDRPLSANAGPDQRVLDESAVTLLGTVSDSDSANPTYSWTQNSGSPAVTLAGSDTLTPTFTAPDVSSDVDLVFTLRVDDGPDTVTDTVTVTVHDAEADFVTTWNTDILTIPIRSSAGSFTVDWGDGKISEYATIATDGNIRHIYDVSGTYTIRISGNFSEIFLGGDSGTAEKLQSIDQWGDIKWTTMAGAFFHAGNMLYNATDVPDLSSVTDMSFMFARTGFSSDDLSGWNVSGVTDMRSMFTSSGYTGDLSGWDVSSVTDMQNMFSRASSFDSDLSDWDVSAVNNMNSMFFRASSFDSDLSGWNVSAVTGMNSMFLDASSFDSDLSGWNVSAVTGMNSMFLDASSFNQPLNDWDVSAVTDMNGMFFSASDFNGDISGWNVSAVTDMTAMFSGASDFNGDISSWNVSSVTTMQNMFFNAASFNSDLSGWNVSAVNNMDDMFSGASSFEQNLGPWYIVLDSDTISYPTQTLEIMAQNSFLDGQDPMYGLGAEGLFVVDADAGTLGLDPNSDPPPNEIYQVNVTSTGNFGTANHHTVSVTVDNADPAVMPPTFYSSVFNNVTGVLTIVFSETIDAANVVPAKIHIRESGNYTDGITLSAGEFVTVANDTAISFILIASHLTTVTGLTTPELTIEPGAVQDTSSNLIDGTFDASTAVFVDATSVASRDDKPQGMAFSSDGTKMFVVGDQNNVIIEYTLSPAFDVSSAVFVPPAFSVASEDGIPTGMAFSDDGTKMFVIGDSGNNINEYTLTTAFDVSSASYDGDIERFSFSSERSYPTDMAFSNDGTQMFVLDNTNDEINEYTLSTPFDISNATSTDVIFSVTEEEDFPLGIAFSNDGAKMFVVGGNDVNEYTLKAAFDIFNATFVDATALISSGDIATSGIAFSNDGAKMFAITYFGDEIYEYTLSSVYPITVTDIIAVDNPPTIYAGDDQDVTKGSTYTLTGATATDVEDVDSTLEILWTQVPAGTVTITNGNTLTPTIDVPSTTTATSVTLTMSVTDSVNPAVTDARVLTIQDAVVSDTPPTIDAGDDQDVTKGSTYTLTGATATDDEDNDIDLTIEWTQVPAGTVTITNGNTLTPTIDVPSTTTATSVTLTMSVTDSVNPAVTDARVLTIQDVVVSDTPPTIDAGDDQDVTKGSTYTLTGATATDDEDNDIDLTIEWTQVPAGTVTITNGNTLTPTIDVPSTTTATSVTLTMSVTDSVNPAVTDARVLTIQDVVVSDTPPTIDAGDDQDVTKGSTYTLTGATATDDEDNDIDLTIEWTQVPAGTVTITNGNTLTPTIDVPSTTTATSVTLTMSVTDSVNPAVTDARVLTIQDVVVSDTPPTIDAGDDQDVTKGSTYTLTGATATDDEDNDIDLTIEWTQVPAGTVTITNGNTLTPTIDVPSTTTATSVTLTMSVTDSVNPAVTDARVLTIQDAVVSDTPPTIDAGDDQDVTKGSTYTLTGATATDDEDNDIDLTIEWTQVPAGTVTITNGNTLTPTIDVPSTTTATSVTLTMSVTDSVNPAVTDARVLTIQDVVVSDTPPTIDAGDDQDVTKGSTYTLTGATATDDEDNDIDLTIEWTQVPAGTVTITNGNTLTPTIDVPSTTTATSVTLTMSVTDSVNPAVTDARVLTIQDAVVSDTPPTIDAGDDQDVTKGSTYTLTGATATDDEDNDIDLTIEWTQVPAGTVTITNGNTLTPTIDVPSTTTATSVTLTMSVTDSVNPAVTDARVLTIQDAVVSDTPPTIDAGDDQDVTKGSTYTLTGATATDDEDNDIDLTIEWTQVPAGTVTITNGNTLTPTIDVPSTTTATSVTLTMSVTDSVNPAVTDARVLTIQDAVVSDTPPTIDAGDDQDVTKGSTYTLTGATATDDEDNDIDLTIEWTQVPAGTVTITNGNTLTPTIDVPSTTTATSVTLTMSVTDSVNPAVTDARVLTIQDAVVSDTPPTIDAGDDQDVTKGSTYTLTGATATDDEDNDIDLTIEWTQVPAGTVTITNGNTLTPTIDVPSTTTATSVTLTMSVTDSVNPAVTNTRVLTIQDAVVSDTPPTIYAGDDQDVTKGSTYTLTGATATDVEDVDSTLEILWTQVPAGTVTITNGDTLTPTIDVPSTTTATSVTLTMSVTDSVNPAVTNTRVLTIQDVVNTAPTVYAGGPLRVALELSVSTNPTVDDPDGDTDHTYTWTQSPINTVTFSDVNSLRPTITAPASTTVTDVRLTLTVVDGEHTVDAETTLNIYDPATISNKKSSSSSSSTAPIVDLNTLVQARIVDIPPAILEQISSHDASDPLEPILHDDAFDCPLTINEYCYLLDDLTNTLTPQTVTADQSTEITFTVYTQKDLAHFALYLNLSDENTDYADSDTYITYKNDDGTTGVTDPHGYIGSATITVTQEDDSVPEKKTVRIVVEFAEPMGPTNMVAYMWNTDRKATFIKIIDAFEVVTSLEPEMQAADPEPLEPDSELPADPEPVSSDVLWPADDYDDAQVLQIIRMWSGFEPEMITDEQLLASLGLDHLDADIPGWMMTELGVLAAKGDVTVDEFVLALQYVLENL